MIEKREFKTGLLKSEDFLVVKKIEVGKPTILEVMKAHFKKMYNSLNEKIKSLTLDNFKLRSENLDLKKENLKLITEVNKYKTLSLTGEEKKKESPLDKIVAEYEKSKLEKKPTSKEIFERVDQMSELAKKDQEQTKPKQQNRGYELR